MSILDPLRPRVTIVATPEEFNFVAKSDENRVTTLIRLDPDRKILAVGEQAQDTSVQASRAWKSSRDPFTRLPPGPRTEFFKNAPERALLQTRVCSAGIWVAGVRYLHSYICIRGKPERSQPGKGAG